MDIHEKYLFDLIILNRKSIIIRFIITVIILLLGISVLIIALLSDFSDNNEYLRTVLTISSALISAISALPIREIIDRWHRSNIWWNLRNDYADLNNGNKNDKYALDQIRKMIWNLTEKFISP